MTRHQKFLRRRKNEVKEAEAKNSVKAAADDLGLALAKIMFSHEVVSQADFARAVGTDPAVISRLVSREVLTPGADGLSWSREYFAYRKGFEAGRRSSGLY